MDEQPTMTIDTQGNKRWLLHGQPHRVDGPAVEWAGGGKGWYLHGLLHRIGGPAYESAHGTKEFYLHGQLHRAGGPAIEYASGTKEFYLHGQLHREDGPAIQCHGGRTSWFWHGVHVPQHVVLQPETITVHEIEGEPNAEVRRVMIDRFGLDRYISEAQFHTLVQDDFGTLLKKRQVNDEDLAVVKVVCPSTGHVHFLRVPPTTTTPLEGVAWTFDMTPRSYLLTAEA